jgi:hypothetical protein
MPAGRPLKNGVDYFPLDVVCDDKVELIEAEHGIQGFGILIKLYQKIYANNYWIKWDKKAILVFSNRINVDINSINAVINSCIEWDIFNKKLHKEYDILTSRGIQKRFFEIVKRRKVVEVCDDFLLIDIDINVYNNLIYVDHNQQRKGKEKESKEKETIYTSNFISFWESYPRRIGKGKAFESYKKIKDPRPSLQIILDAIKIQNKTDQWKDVSFIPHPATWLNQRRWEDEFEPLNGSQVSKIETPEQIQNEIDEALL